MRTFGSTDAGEFMATFHTIVAAIDFSESSFAAAKTAAAMAGETYGQLHLIHVVPNVFESPWLTNSHGLAFTTLQRDLIDAARTKLVTLAATEPFRATKPTCTVATGSVAEAIVRYAVEHHADLIVLGTHGYGPLKRFLLGHVADRVIRHARCPVLALPHETLRTSEPTDTHRDESLAIPVGAVVGDDGEDDEC